MSKVFAFSDPHFGHHNIIRYCERPFKSTGPMDADLLRRYNERVSPSDTVFFLGDFAMGPRVDENFILRVLASLNGAKNFILGNHDQPNKKYKQKGLKAIIEDNDLEIGLLSDIHEERIEGTDFIMCHYPMDDWNGKFNMAVHLHGHQHNQFNAAAAKRQTQDRKYDVGVDMFGGPVRLTGDLRFLNDPKGWFEPEVQNDC